MQGRLASSAARIARSGHAAGDAGDMDDGASSSGHSEAKALLSDDENSEGADSEIEIHHPAAAEVPAPAPAAAGVPAPAPAAAGPAAAAGPSFFNGVLGVREIQAGPHKRRSTCKVCAGEILTSDVRCVYAFARRRPHGHSVSTHLGIL